MNQTIDIDLLNNYFKNNKIECFNVNDIDYTIICKQFENNKIIYFKEFYDIILTINISSKMTFSRKNHFNFNVCMLNPEYKIFINYIQNQIEKLNI